MHYTISKINEELAKYGWKTLETKYINLDTVMRFQCDQGHDVSATWRQVRESRNCPTCMKTALYQGVAPKEQRTYNQNRILAIDQATHKSGWAVFENGKLAAHGSFEVKDGDLTFRYNQVRKIIIQKAQFFKADLVVFEDIQLQQLGGKQVYSGDNVTGVQTFKTLAQLQGAIMDGLYDHGIPFEICHQATWRQHCGVKGRSRTDRKHSMQTLVEQWYGIKVNDDEADAIGIGKYASETKEFTPKVEPPKVTKVEIAFGK